VSWGEFDEQQSKTCADDERINPEILVKPGDFLFSRANTVELVGACVIAKRVSLRVMLSDKILRLVLTHDDLKPWLLFLLRSQIGRKQIDLRATGNQESMKNIGQERLRSIAIPFGPRGELEHAIALMKKEFASAGVQLAAIERSFKQSSAQRQNILRAAFSGQLVPQDASDEPARVLLARIRANRADGSVVKKLRGLKAREAA
jgi:type I restriction enzyme S subunit